MTGLTFCQTEFCSLTGQGECEQSRAVAQKWLDARPHSLNAQQMLGIGFMCSDDYEEAIHLREKVVDKVAHFCRNDVSSTGPFHMQPMACILRPPGR